MERINLSSIKKESVRAIFHAITGKDQISRAEIAELTGLSLMTVGKVVDALLERHVIIQSKEIKNMAGRRAGLVSLNTDKFFMIIDLTDVEDPKVGMEVVLLGSQGEEHISAIEIAGNNESTCGEVTAAIDTLRVPRIYLEG